MITHSFAMILSFFFLPVFHTSSVLIRECTDKNMSEYSMCMTLHVKIKIGENSINHAIIISAVVTHQTDSTRCIHPTRNFMKKEQT
jgi:hypothetical protein